MNGVSKKKNESPGYLGGRGRRYSVGERTLILSLVVEAVERGARQAKACETLGLDRRTVQRWKYGPSEDQRRGPRRSPSNKMSVRERRYLLEVANQPEHRDLPPSQIVPRLADNGEYVGSESKSGDT